MRLIDLKTHAITPLGLASMMIILLPMLGVTRAVEVPLDCNNFLAAGQYHPLLSVDPSNANSFLIGDTDLATTEIEFDIKTGKLYGEGSDGDQNLYEIDPTTGEVNGYVIHPYGALNGMEYVDSVLYATFIDDSQAPSMLVIVDVSTGNLTPVGPTGFGPISGLAYDGTTMWGVTAPDAELVTVNLTTGSATFVANLITSEGQPLNRVGSIEFGPDGQLYGGLTESALILPRYLVQIDTTSGVVTPVGDTGFSITGLTSCFRDIEIAVDIKPTSCPNPMNVKSKGVLPAAILGFEDFDVMQVDPASVRLFNLALDEPVEVVPLRWAYEDVATPYEPYIGKEDAFDCTEAGPDGYYDLTLKFDTQEIVAALDGVEDRDVLVLQFTGSLKEEYGGTPIVGEDVIVILQKTRKKNR